MIKTLVIGAGGGGLSSALLSGLRGEEVTILEAHSYLGGCASYYKRGPFVFDVGATTVSGIGPLSPLGELFDLIGEKPNLVPVDPGIIFHLSDGKKVSYHCDFELWMSELEKHFPQQNHRAFWTLVHEVALSGWSFLKDVPQLSKACFYPKYYKLLPHLLLSTEMMLKKFQLSDPSYLELINGILIISAQAYAHDVPFLVGAMALTYPKETYAPEGGMMGLMNFFEQQCLRLGVKILKNHKVLSIQPGLHVQTEKGQIFKADRVISNLTVWDMPFLKEAHKKEGHWGAFTLSFAVPSQIKELYQQVHLKNKIVENYFISFSLPNDLARAPEGWQVVTISTHVEATSWFEINNYQEKKEQYSEIIMHDFLSRFNISEVKFLSAGTPKTFERYTGRKNGFVGGIPFLYGKSPFSLLSFKTEMKEFYRVGDTTFPGQGLVGVVAGSLNLHRYLK